MSDKFTWKPGDLIAKRPARKGDRVRLVRCTDPHTNVRAGAMGTVVDVDATGTVHVK